MIAFPDTSFLFALYVAQSNSAAAVAHCRRLAGSLPVSALLLGEFRQSVRFQIYRHNRDPDQGYPRRAGQKALERLSAEHTIGGGHRFLDLLHVATAVHLQAEQFLSFDSNQRRLAAAQGIKPQP